MKPLLPASFPDSAEFFDVEGMPVVLNWDAAPYCACFDVSPPRKFDPGSARRNGAPIKEPAFRALVAEAHKGA